MKLTDEEIVAAFWERTRDTLKRPAVWHLPDGRLDPEKCFGFVLEGTKLMTPLEFRAMNRLAGNSQFVEPDE